MLPPLLLSCFLPPCGVAVHRHPRSPTGDGARPPAFWPPPPSLASSHSSLHAHTIATRTAVRLCNPPKAPNMYRERPTSRRTFGPGVVDPRLRLTSLESSSYEHQPQIRPDLATAGKTLRIVQGQYVGQRRLRPHALHCPARSSADFFRPSSSVRGHSTDAIIHCLDQLHRTAALPGRDWDCILYLFAKLGLEHRGSRVPILFTSPRVVLINSVRTDTCVPSSQHHQILRTSRLRCRIGYNDCGQAARFGQLVRSMRSRIRLRRSTPPSIVGWPSAPRAPTADHSCTQAE